MPRTTRPASSRPLRLATLAGAATLTGLASAQQIAQQGGPMGGERAPEAFDVLASQTTDRVRYDDHAVVSVRAMTVRQLMAAQAMSAGLWSESFRLDATEFLVHTDRIADLRELGMDVEVGRILHPSPASPAANRGWAAQATHQLRELGIAVP